MSDHVSDNAQEDDDGQDRTGFNYEYSRCRRGGGFDKEEDARLGSKLNQELKSTMRTYLGLENEMKEVNKQILEERDRKIEERKNEEIECKSPFGVGGDKDKEKEKEKRDGMDIESDDDDDDTTTVVKNKPQVYNGPPTISHPTAPAIAPVNRRGRNVPYRICGMLKRPPTPPSSSESTVPSSSSQSDSSGSTEDGLVTTDFIKPNVTYRIKGDSFIPRKFIYDEDKGKGKGKGKQKEEGEGEDDVNMHDDI